MSTGAIVPAIVAHNGVAGVVEMYSSMVRSYEATNTALAARVAELTPQLVAAKEMLNKAEEELRATERDRIKALERCNKLERAWPKGSALPTEG